MQKRDVNGDNIEHIVGNIPAKEPEYAKKDENKGNPLRQA